MLSRYATVLVLCSYFKERDRRINNVQVTTMQLIDPYHVSVLCFPVFICFLLLAYQHKGVTDCNTGKAESIKQRSIDSIKTQKS